MSDEKPTYPSRTADQFVVRFPDGMRDRLKEAAAANGRSMNAEIVTRILQSFDAYPGAEDLRRQLEENTISLRRLENSALLAHEVLSMLLTKNLDPELEQSPVAISIRAFLQATKPGAASG